MVDTDRLHTLTPSAAATLVGVGPHSIRRWCEWHALHLSNSANPGQGGQRRLTLHDVEVLKEVSNLRLQGLQTDQINEKLAQLTFAEIDNEIDPGPDDNALALPDERQATPANLVALDVITTLQSDVAAIKQAMREEKRGQRDYVQGLAVGFVGALLFVILLLLLASLYGGR